MMHLADFIGLAGSVISFILWLPQAIRTWQVRHDPEALKGISVGTQILLLANASLWGLYAAVTGAFWVGAPGLLNAPLALATIGVVLHTRRRLLGLAPEEKATL